MNLDNKRFVPASTHESTKLNIMKNHLVVLCVIILAGFISRLHSFDFAIETLTVPDGIEYSFVPQYFKKYHTWRLRFNHTFIPSRYPFGVSLLLLPFTYLFHNEGAGIILLLLVGTGVIPMIYYLVKKIFDADVAILSALIVSLCPLTIKYSSIIMSDMISGFFLILILLIYFYYADNKMAYVIMGICSGYMFMLRFSNALFFIPILLLIIYKNNIRSISEKILLFMGPICAFIIITMIYDRGLLGGVFITG